MARMKLKEMRVVKTNESKTRKDGEEKTTYTVKLDSGDGITAVLKSPTEFDLHEGEAGLTLTIDNPQTRLSDKIAEGKQLVNDYVEASKAMADIEGKKRKPDVMVEDKTGKKPKGSKALDEMSRPMMSPDDFKAAIDNEVKRLGGEADKKLAKVKKERKE